MSRELSPRETFWGLGSDFGRDWSRSLDRLFGDFGVPATRWNKEVLSFAPAVDVAEQEGRFVLTFDIPGVKKDEIKIDVVDNQLIVSGERKREHTEERKGGYTLTERSVGTFRRAFGLPGNVDTHRIEAKYEDGVLRLTVPKDEQQRTKRIEIK